MKYAINFDVGFYKEIEAKNKDDALNKVKDMISDIIDTSIADGTEGEAHNFEVEAIRND